ncbi:MAG: hypothetical protein QXN76_02085 [Nanopusillaceae archaeon]
MTKNIIKEFVLYLLTILFITALFITIYFFDIIKKIEIVERCIYIPAVSGNRGVITMFCLKVIKGAGRVFIEIPNVFSSNYQLSFAIAKLAACKLLENCNLYDYLFYTKDYFIGEGFSGTAGLATLIVSYFYLPNKNFLNNISVTGFILPNGLIFPVSGIKEKLEASKLKNLTLLAPSNYSNEIIQIYTILDIAKLLRSDIKNYLKKFEIPKEYFDVLKEIALDICKDIDDRDIDAFIKNSSFYTAASLCFIKKSEEYKISNISLADLESEIAELEKLLINYKCNSYNCEELKFQALLRINMSKEILDLNKKYWRFYTAKGWYKMLEKLKDIERKDTCKIIEEDYKIMGYILNKDFSQEISCFEKRELLSRIYYEFLLNYDIDISLFLDSVENYLNYLYEKNGFSITSYNYFVYGRDLINMGKISDGILYLIYAVNYAI